MTAFKRISGFLLIISVLAFLAIQFFQIDKAEIGYDHKNSYEYIAKPPKDVKNLLADACADCHTVRLITLGILLYSHLDGGFKTILNTEEST